MDGDVYCAGSSRMWPACRCESHESKSTCFHIEMKFGPIHTHSVGNRRKMNTICYRFAHVTENPEKKQHLWKTDELKIPWKCGMFNPHIYLINSFTSVNIVMFLFDLTRLIILIALHSPSSPGFALIKLHCSKLSKGNNSNNKVFLHTMKML